MLYCLQIHTVSLRFEGFLFMVKASEGYVMLRPVGDDAVLAIQAKENVNLGMIFICGSGLGGADC